jgi:hypothetical protein
LLDLLFDRWNSGSEPSERTLALEAGAIEPLKGYDAAFALRGWRDATKAGAPDELAGHDLAMLRTQIPTFMTAGRVGYVELAAWNFELNDWVRLDAFEAPGHAE